MKTIHYIFRSKYLITGIAFAVWMVFFDRNDIPLQIKRARELSNLKQSEKNMALQILTTKKELELLKNSSATLESYAREKYLMKKDNEDLYIVTFDSSAIR
ncbi:MAG: septum formation initiator family protein [Ginsengibacter sp.]